MVLFLLDTNFNQIVLFTTLNGTTPVTLAVTDVYHFSLGFVVAGGTAYSRQGFASNIGALYVGSGTFNTTTGFATNYMWNRPGDGFVSSTIYVCPKGYIALLKSVKFNSDTSVSTIFQTIGRSARTAPWSIGSEDTVNTTLVIERSLNGGFVGAGGEYTCVARKTVNTANISCNFVMTLLEVRVPQSNPNNAM
jgi:hypothetical protein